MIVPKFLLLYLPHNHEFAHYLRKKEVLLHVQRGHANFILRRWEEMLGRDRKTTWEYWGYEERSLPSIITDYDGAVPCTPVCWIMNGTLFLAWTTWVSKCMGK